MTATVHPRVLAYLGRALSLELTAVQQYMTQASLAESWGDREAADRFRHETVEEMQHAERIVARMISLGVAPGASQLKAVTTAPTLEGLLERNTDLEDQLIRHYAEASRFCQQIQDDGNRSFFEALLAEEQSHGREVASWLADQQGPMPVALERAPF
ncbi:MAG: ferritin-like domain-containing protein [Cyanobacteriota bacterium]|nr:ferritin-like domain-containing protein [Cyanobacteriota bacterium]